MNVLIVTDFRAYSYNNSLYLGTQFSTIAKRYKEAFGEISLCLRIYTAEKIPAGFEYAEKYVREYYAVGELLDSFKTPYKKKVEKMILECDLMVVRCPAMIGITAARIAKKIGKPYLSELMGDAWDGYWNHGGIVGKIAAPFLLYATKCIVKNGNYALYVTKEWLQKRYPCPGLTESASNVLITNLDESSLDNKRGLLANFNDKVLTITTTAAVNVRHKGHEYMIKAIPILNKKGVRVHYKLIGGGDQSYLSELAHKLGVQNQVEFVGRQSLEEIFKILDDTDIYVQPSLQEGLPRSVIEAMSRACLVIGSRTAGTPEIVEADCVVERKSTSDIVEKILYLRTLTHAERMAMSKRNFARSKDFLADVLDERRNKFYDAIKKDIKKHV